MENSREILARIPNPNASHPTYIMASKVATLDFMCAAYFTLFNLL
jgi:hypothetical protein